MPCPRLSLRLHGPMVPFATNIWAVSIWLGRRAGHVLELPAGFGATHLGPVRYA